MRVKIVGHKGDMTLVQWQDENDIPQRTWVMDMDVESDEVDIFVEHPEQGIPYAFDFSQVLTVQISSHDVLRELRKRHIWTLGDLRANPQGALGALMTAAGLGLEQLLQAANDYEKVLKS